jgi:hypoxanthine phosphoribosyltransferase
MFCLINSRDIATRVGYMGAWITARYFGSPPTVLCIMNGSLYFAADLTRKIDLNLPRVETIKARSYKGTLSGPIQVSIDAIDDEAFDGKDVLLIDDILETGQTLHRVTELVRGRGARNVDICVLLVKDCPEGRRYPITPTFAGFEIEPVWVVGYGLDWDNSSRNQTYIGIPRDKFDPKHPPAPPRIWLPKSPDATWPREAS